MIAVTPPAPSSLPWSGRCEVVGILNVTPDSFSDGGRFSDTAAAVRHGVRLAAEGAALVDVGGESTRPGADRVSEELEMRRVLPVVTGLVEEGVAVSVDTTRAAVAARCLDAGALAVNDVSGGLADPDMARVVSGSGALWILMHWRGHSRDMSELASYDDVVAEVRLELSRRVEAAVAAGCDPRNLVVDPGLGFAKRPEHNWQLLARLGEIVDLGLPVLLGASRKSFLGALLAQDAKQPPRAVEDRESATVATTVLAAAAGAWGVRVHEVADNVDALMAVEAVRLAAGRTPVVSSGRGQQ